MSLARRKDTKPELDVRRILHAQGLRYRVTHPVPGLSRRTIDIAFTRCKVAVFLDGCFWHGCPEHGTRPRANADWWVEKLDGNARRDIETNAALVAQGWTVLRFWEHESPLRVADRVQSTVATRTQPAPEGVGSCATLRTSPSSPSSSPGVSPPPSTS